MSNKKLDIYPPTIFDPLKPGGTPSPTEGAMNAIEKCQRLAAEIADFVDKLPDPVGGTPPAPSVEQGGPAGGMLATPDPDAVKRDAYLGDLAKDSLAAAEEAGEVEPDEAPEK